MAPGDSPLNRRIGLTALLAGLILVLEDGRLVAWLLGWVLLPVYDAFGAPLDLREELGLWPLSGLGSVLAAYFLVEVVAAVVPKWRALRDGADGRRKLRRWVVLLAVLLTAIRAMGFSYWLHGLGYGWLGLDVAVWVLALGGLALCVWIAETVSRRGLGNGYALFLAFGAAYDFFAQFQARHLNEYSLVDHFGGMGVLQRPEEMPMVLLVTVAMGVSVVWALRRGDRFVDGGAFEAWWLLPGIMPLVWATLPFRVGSWWDVGYETLEMASVALAVAGGVALSRFFWPQARIAEAWSPHPVGPFRRSLWESCVALFGWSVLSLWATRSGLFLDAVTFFIVGAYVLDVRDELAFRRAQGALEIKRTLMRVWMVPVALREMEEAGTIALARGRRFYSLFHIFSPATPIEIMVPTEEQERGPYR